MTVTTPLLLIAVPVILLHFHWVSVIPPKDLFLSGWCSQDVALQELRFVHLPPPDVTFLHVLSTQSQFMVFAAGVLEAGVWGAGVWGAGVWEAGVLEAGVWGAGVWEAGVWGAGVWGAGVWGAGVWVFGHRGRRHLFNIGNKRSATSNEL